MLSEQVEKLKRFVASKGLGEAFAEYVRSLAPKTMKQRLADARSEADAHNRKKKLLERGKTEKSKKWQQEI